MSREKGEGTETRLISRQGTLAAIREVLRAGNFEDGDLEVPTLATAVLLVHAVSAGMSEIRESANEFVGRMPAGLMMEMVRNGLFNQSDDVMSVLDRTVRVWQDPAMSPRRVKLRIAPRELLSESLGGVSFEDFFALGAWIWIRAKLWTETILKNPSQPREPITLSASLPGIVLEQRIVAGFLDHVAAEPAWFAGQFKDEHEAYNFLPLQTRPIVRLDDALLVLDETYLLQKFTMLGLFWAVHDHERDRDRKRGRTCKQDRELWNQAHGEIIEILVTERLPYIAPLAHDPSANQPANAPSLCNCVSNAPPPPGRI